MCGPSRCCVRPHSLCCVGRVRRHSLCSLPLAAARLLRPQGPTLIHAASTLTQTTAVFAMQWMPHALARAVVMLLLVSSASASDVPPPKPGSVDSGTPPCPEPNPGLQSASSGGGRVDISELLPTSTLHSLTPTHALGMLLRYLGQQHQ
jgi:hypothetical protein